MQSAGESPRIRHGTVWSSGDEAHQPIDDTAIRCTECNDEVDEFTAIAKGWRYYSNGCGDLLPLPGC